MLTWEESKAHLALFAVTSSPLFLANDLRPGFVQKRLLGIVANPTMMEVDQAYTNGFAGDRIASEASGKEIWAKPLVGHTTAVVLFNRAGQTFKCMATSSIDAPCDDYPNATSGAQPITLDFAVLAEHADLSPLPPAAELERLRSVTRGAGGGGDVACDVVDVYGPHGDSSVPLGRFTGNFTRVIPPHGVAFLLVGNCSVAKQQGSD